MSGWQLYCNNRKVYFTVSVSSFRAKPKQVFVEVQGPSDDVSGRHLKPRLECSTLIIMLVNMILCRIDPSCKFYIEQNAALYVL